MRTGTSFARDWQLIKVARSLQRHDVTGSLLQKLLADAPAGLTERIAAIARRLGEENGTELVTHAEERLDPPTLMEGLLLTWGIPCESTDGDDGGVAIVVDGAATAVREAFADVRVAEPYLAGYARALQRDAVLDRGAGGRMTILFPPRGE
ncbi:MULTISPECIES: hypothetical protein [Methanoculleus]|uniref:Uncharacterized protein n=2 Tax=Methanoculleus TaxID=45989 RepID=A3CUV4_METMJ|nr:MULTISPECIES: hypothetical protein [Methanoculleus]ABN57154.1 hypothetical protein Memar_1223 [Methanoculleus marisnigri JR1]UYU18570.1 hypothetical protein OH143_00340 [Methanoculleus submarinus]